MLYIDPEECIDCDACVEACPVDACFAEDQLPDEWQKYIQINADYFKPEGGRRLGRHRQRDPRSAAGSGRRQRLRAARPTSSPRAALEERLRGGGVGIG